MEHMPELTLIPWQGLSLAKECHPCFTATSMTEGEMGNAGGWGSFSLIWHIRIKKTEQAQKWSPQAIPLGRLRSLSF